MNILAAASASGDEDATATAGIGGSEGDIVFQSAWATGTEGNASVAFANTGTINVAASANAVGGGDVLAVAFADRIDQRAFGGSEGTANVAFTNEGPLTVSAYATGLGGGDGSALAFASGIAQLAVGGSGAIGERVQHEHDRGYGERQCHGRQRGAPGLLRPGERVGDRRPAGRLWWHGFGNSHGGPNFTEDFGVNAYASQIMTGVAFTRTESGSLAPTGPAVASLTNTGMIAVAGKGQCGW